MNIWEIIFAVVVVGLLVALVYLYTGGTCKWFGHEWVRVSSWDREYQCRRCGQSRG